MSVSTQVGRIIAILQTNTSIRSVTRGTLRAVNTTPAFFVVTGDSTRELHGNDQIVNTRSYSIFGVIKPVEAGREFDAEEALEPWFDTVEALFDNRPGLWLTDYSDTLDGVQDAFLISDPGFGVITVAGANYAGTEWILRVVSHKQVTRGQ